MRHRHTLVQLVCVLALIGGACGSNGDATAPPASAAPDTTPRPTASSATSSTTTSTAPPEAIGDTTTWHRYVTFSDDCDGLGPAPADGESQVTFVRDGRWYAVAADTGDRPAPCLADDVLTGSLLWGPAGDRAIVGGRLLVDTAGTPAVSPAAVSAGASFTRPTGTSIVAVVDGRIVKTNVDSGAPLDISFLAHHDDVTYYPSGTHIVTAGRADDGTTGIWLATNTGTEATLLASSPDTTFSGLAITDEGTTLVFAADHGDETHVHRTQLAGEVLVTSQDERQAETLLTTDRALVSVAVGLGGEVAIGHGTCADDGPSGTELVTTFDQTGHRAADDATGWPIGFLHDGTLVLATNATGCFDPAATFSVVLRDHLPATADIVVVEGVTAAAVRVPVGEPPPPPADNPSGFV